MSDNSLASVERDLLQSLNRPLPFFLGKRMAARKALAKLINCSTADVKSAAAHGYVKQEKC